MSKNLLLTGCAGFIGLNFIKYFTTLWHGYDKVVSIDKLGYATEYNTGLYLNICESVGIRHITLDLSNIEEMPILPEGKWDILDFASESHVDNSIKDPNKIFNENVKIPGGVISMVGLDNIDRYIHISTDEVYSEIPLDKVDDMDYWFKPTDSIKPNNPYSASKAAQDCYLMAMKHTFGLNVNFIRLANQFGPFQHPEKMFPATILRVVGDNPIKIYGKGENIRQWTPVVDSVKVIYDALIGKLDNEFIDNVLHISKYELSEDGKQILYNNNDVVSCWEKLLTQQIEEKGLEVSITKQYIEDRKGHDTAYALTTTEKIQTYFQTPLEERFKETIEFYVELRQIYGVK